MVLVGIDVGTSGVKALMIDTSGRVLAEATESYPLLTPKPLWAEQNPEDWWQATCKAIRRLFEQSGVSPQEVKGVGLSGQMHGSVFLDAEDRVLRPALLWCDQRTADECAWITERVGERKVLETTLNPVLTGFQAGKIIWLARHEPELYARMCQVLLPKDYIRFMLTGEFATEVSDASGTASDGVFSEAVSAAAAATASFLDASHSGQPFPPLSCPATLQVEQSSHSLPAWAFARHWPGQSSWPGLLSAGAFSPWLHAEQQPLTTSRKAPSTARMPPRPSTARAVCMIVSLVLQKL